MRSSPFGVDYPAPIFLRTPINHIERILSELDNLDRGNANITSATNAQLCYLVRQAIHIFSHNTTPLEDQPRRYLPFPDFSPEGEAAKRTGPTALTRIVLRDSLRRGQIPPHVFMALLSSPEGGG